MAGRVARQPHDRHVEIEQERPLRVVAHEALHPEEGGDARAARHRRDLVHARRRIQHHVAGRELHPLSAVRVVHGELAAVVRFRLGEKQRRGEIGADLHARSRQQAHAAVDVRAERLCVFVAIEHRRVDPRGERRRQEQRIALERRKDDVAELARDGRALDDLTVALHLRALVSRRRAAVHPGVAGRVEACTSVAHARGIEDAGHAQQHG